MTINTFSLLTKTEAVCLYMHVCVSVCDVAIVCAAVTVMYG